MNKSSKIYIAGHTGMVGSAIMRNLRKKGFSNIVTRTLKELDLTDQQATALFFQQKKPEYVFLAAAKVGGIMANSTYRAQFIYENIQIQSNVIHQSYLNKVKKLLFLGSSCIYPKNAPQPIKEEFLLTGELEYTNEPYAIAKIAGLKMCEAYNIQYGTNFISVMPTSLYGPGDNFDLETSHVLAAIIRKMHLGKCLENNNWEAIRKDFDKNPVEGVDGNAGKQQILEKLSKYGIQLISEISTNPLNPCAIALWGSGNPRREFLHVDDIADACVHLMKKVSAKQLYSVFHPRNPQKSVAYEARNTHINIGTGEDLTIKELAKLITDIVGFKKEIKWDTEKPDGTPRKLLDVNKMKKLAWTYNIALKEGLKKNYSDYIKGIE